MSRKIKDDIDRTKVDILSMFSGDTDGVKVRYNALFKLVNERNEMLHRLIEMDEIHVDDDGRIYWECCGDTVGE